MSRRGYLLVARVVLPALLDERLHKFRHVAQPAGPYGGHWGDGEVGCLRNNHPQRDLQSKTTGGIDRHQASAPPWRFRHAERQPLERVEWVVNGNFREEGILPALAWCVTSH